MQRVCKHCEGEFETKEPDRVYCSKLCKQKAYYYRTVAKKAPIPKRLCGFCLCEFQPTSPTNLYCSTLCRNKQSAENRLAEEKDPDSYSVTTPYGSHGFDWWVKCALEGQGGVSHV